MPDQNISIQIADNVSPAISVKIDGIAASARTAQSAIDALKTSLAAINVSALSTLTQANGAAAQATQALATAQQAATGAAINAAAAQKSATAAIAASTGTNAQAATSLAKLDAELENFLASNSKAYKIQRDFQAGQDLLNRAFAAGLLSQKSYNESLGILKNNFEAAGKAATVGANALKDVEGASNKVGLSAGQTARGLHSLVDEISSNRIRQAEGTFSNLAITFFGLGGTAIAVAAAIVGVAVAIGLIISKGEEVQRAINAVSLGFQSTGGYVNLSKQAIADYINQLNLLPGVSREDASKTIAELSRIPFITAQQFDQTTKIVGDFAFALGTSAPDAAKKLAQAFADPVAGAKKLDEQFNILSADQLLTIQHFAETGDKASALSIIIEALEGRFKGIRDSGSTPLQKALGELSVAYDELVRSFSNNDGTSKAYNALVGILQITTDVIKFFKENISTVENFFLTFAKNIPQIGAAVTAIQLLLDKRKEAQSGISGKLQISGDRTSLYSAANYGSTDNSASQVQDEQLKTLLKNTDRFSKGSKADQSKQDLQLETDLKKALNDGNLSYTAREEILKRIRGIEEARTRLSRDPGADAIKKANQALDDQIARQLELKPLREQDAAFDKIKETVLQKKGTKLSDPEADNLRAKIALIEKNKVVQKEMDAIYETAVAPARDYNATITAANLLLKDGNITQEQYGNAVRKAAESYANSIDPLRQFNKELDQQLAVLQQLPRDQEITRQLQQAENKLLAEGKVLTDAERISIIARTKAVRDANDASTAQNQLLSDSVEKRRAFNTLAEQNAKLKANPGDSGFTAGDSADATDKMIQGLGLDTTNLKVHADAAVNTYDVMLQQIKKLRDQNLIDESTADNLSLQAKFKLQNTQLTGAENFFNSLAVLSKSKNKTLAAIGKTAAISGAVIDTYKAATGAYASLASIPYVGPFLGAAAAAAAIAAGIANVNQIRSQNAGFQAGGYTGDIPTDQIAGPVHGKEYVFDAAATSRIGVANLESLRSGATAVAANKPPSTLRTSDDRGTATPSGQPQAQPVTVNHRTINVLDPNLISDYFATPEGETAQLNFISRNSDSIRALVS